MLIDLQSNHDVNMMINLAFCFSVFLIINIHISRNFLLFRKKKNSAKFWLKKFFFEKIYGWKIFKNFFFEKGRWPDLTYILAAGRHVPLVAIDRTSGGSGSTRSSSPMKLSCVSKNSFFGLKSQSLHVHIIYMYTRM